MMLVLAVLLVTVVVGLMLFIRGDCDLTLLWNIYRGKKTDCLSGKVVWITGCSSGIGEALAYQFASVGCKLILSARREQLLNEVKLNCIEKSGGKLTAGDILVLPLDLLAYDTHQDAANTAIKYCKKIDILVNNAGRSQRSIILDTPLSVDRQVFDLDLVGPISITKAILPHFISRGEGHIVVTSSVAGKLGAPGSATYSGAKHGLQGYFDTLRVELYPNNISVTMACPGPVFSEALVHAFTETENKKLDVVMEKSWSRMTATRCAYLMTVATVNRLHEVWLSPQPELFYCYLFQYTPYLAKKLAEKLGQTRANKVKTGVANLH